MKRAAFTITNELLPAPQWFHISFQTGWGVLVTWGPAPIRGSGLEAAEVEITYDRVPTGEVFGWCSPDKLYGILEMVSHRKRMS